MRAEGVVSVLKIHDPPRAILKGEDQRAAAQVLEAALIAMGDEKRVVVASNLVEVNGAITIVVKRVSPEDAATEQKGTGATSAEVPTWREPNPETQ